MANNQEINSTGADSRPLNFKKQITVSQPNRVLDIKTAPKLPPQLKKQIKQFEPPVVKPGLIKTSANLTTFAKPSTPLSQVNLESPEKSDPDIVIPRLDDAVSDAAVDEISAHDSDELLSIQDAAASNTLRKKPAKNLFLRIFSRKLSWLIVVILLIVAAFGLPLTRYKILGLVIKKPYSLTLTDSKSNTPISDATVNLDGKTVKTNAAGVVSVTVPVGYATINITKQYYQTYDHRITVSLSKQKSSQHILLLATGRQVPVTVENNITGQPIAGATVAVLNTTARTKSDGQATIVLPTHDNAYSATVSGAGYNNTTAKITVTSKVIATNSFQLTPAGKVYFLANSSGKINVDSVNLDGSDTQVAVAGTGNETTGTTALYNSADSKYLMLKAQRTATAGDNGLYLINTTNNELTTVEEGTNTYTPIGWSGHYFVYEVDNLNVTAGQPGQYVLKSYDADSAHSTTLDQTNATGTATDDASQSFNGFYLINGRLIYNKVWSGDSSYYASNNFTSSINTVNTNGLSQAALQQFPMTTDESTNISTLSSAMYAANELYFAATVGSGTVQYYNYDNGTVAPVSLSAAEFSGADYAAGVTSPSGIMDAFPTRKDGQFLLLAGSADSGTSSQHSVIALNDNYDFYEWVSDSYIVLSYKNSQLDVIPADGLSGNRQPLDIANFLSEPNNRNQ